MTTYLWRGRTAGGENVSGELAVANRGELLSQLRKKKIVVTSVKPKPKELSFKLPTGGIGTKDLAIFTRQFATMINAGLPLVQCLDILSRQLEKEMFRDITKKVMNDIESGQTLCDSFAKHPKAFDASITLELMHRIMADRKRLEMTRTVEIESTTWLILIPASWCTAPPSNR